MFPSILYKNIQIGIIDFLKTTFPVSTPFFAGIIDRLFLKEEVLKGPYISLKLPFKPGTLKTDYFSSLKMDFPPYKHQELAFKRVHGKETKSTLISTGTGSGKTECFLYPILDYCSQKKAEGQEGIKAIIIYPMNALATDQAKRFASTIWKNPDLKGKINVGLYIGSKDELPTQSMQPDKVITDKKTMQLNPPDILMTNYKMLDYLLIRPNDYPIWQNNATDTLKYLVVDELHTFDGAQGTDLACLIRRLKTRLKTPEKYLCCIGTSATLGNNEDATELIDYSSQIFGETFDTEAVISESVLDHKEFLSATNTRYFTLPGEDHKNKIDASFYNNVDSYIKEQLLLWFSNANTGSTDTSLLSEKLVEHIFFRHLIKLIANKVISINEIISGLEKLIPQFSNFSRSHKENLILSFLSLISVAKTKQDNTFLNLRVQYWIRELRRIVAEVKKNPNLRFSDDLTNEQLDNHLPIIHCRECGAMGWAGTCKSGEEAINPDLQQFYIGFFNKHNSIRYLFPVNSDDDILPESQVKLLCGRCLQLINETDKTSCPNCGNKDKLIKIQITNNLKQLQTKVISTNDCPFCEGQSSLTIVGSRAASLISIIISQLFASPFNEDKKLIAFSDSVQDASHRAGFFSARTYRFNLRAAIQQYLLSRSGKISLPELIDGFYEHYQKLLGKNKFITNFIPNYMIWLNDFEQFQNTGRLPQGSQLTEKIKKSLNWEITSEFSFNSRIGRTLEKTGSSVASLDKEYLDNIVATLLEPIRNIGSLRNIDQNDIIRLITGIIYRLKAYGGVFLSDLKSYIESYGTVYTLNRIDHLPNFGKRSRAPRFLTNNNRGRFDRLHGAGKTSWYEQWVVKTLGHLDPLLESYATDVLQEVVSKLTNNKILHSDSSYGHEIWSILPDSLLISQKVRQCRCESCGYQISIPEDEIELWQNMTCLRYNCHGNFILEEEKDDYYGKLYQNADIERIYAEEHTGLLERNVRENLENSFINQDKPWNPNLLSCTPTLEMGIDIGDLSSLILCSIPPTTSSYLQRIGRSGRRDGNSFNIAVANAHPHDLYFYQDPYEMISGKVNTPGCLIDAPAILERQLTAFCFDRWIETGISLLQLPAKLSAVLPELDKKSDQKFPYNLCNFIEKNKEQLFQDFLWIFEDDLFEDAIKALWEYIDGTDPEAKDLIYRIQNAFWETKQEIESLKKRVRSISNEINRRKQSPAHDQNYEKEISELLAERTSLNSIIKYIRGKDVFNFFTDEGLLPNYAFPQAGVVLRSIILKKNPPGEAKKYKSKIYEYKRPSSMAIKELAPQNKFYAEGRKVQIDQIDLNQSEIEEWIFCPNCSHIQLAVLNTDRTCPKCGNELWSDPGQIQKMIRMKQVTATTTDRKSRSWDESEDRDPEFYNKKIIPEVEKDQIRNAFQLENLPFGFEFLKKADFREVNFGSLNNVGRMMMIGGKEVSVSGFEICNGCGKVIPAEGEVVHDFSCKYRNKEDIEFINTTFLYRDFSSEAIRILMPVTSESLDDVKLYSFIAGMYLGLKLKFKGNIDHLQTTVQEMPHDPQNNIKKKYLILYDTVPGGTGYLKQLMKTPKDLTEVFELALNHLKSCPCNKAKHKDGCYQCIYAYRFNYHNPEISRDTAIELFEEIVSNKDKFIQVETIDDISTNALIESELEQLFIHNLNLYKKIPVKLKKAIVNGKPGWKIKVKEMTYTIEPQVHIGLDQGVSVPCRADFVFYPKNETSEDKQIAVFTDGYFFHGNPENAKDQLGWDMAQRIALLRSGKYDIWSLSWDDIKLFNKQNDHFKNFINPKPTSLSKLMQKIDNSVDFIPYKNIYRENSFDLFMSFLADPKKHFWPKYATALIVSDLFHNNMETELELIEKFAETLLTNISVDQTNLPNTGPTRFLYVPDVYPNGNRRSDILAYWKNPVRSTEELFEVNLICRIYDEEVGQQDTWQKTWNGFLHYINIFQFIRNSYFVTTLGIAKGNYVDLEANAQKSKAETTTEKAELSALLDLTDEKYREILIQLDKAGLSLPEIGYEYKDNEEIVAQAEIAYPDIKLALLHSADYEFEEFFSSRKWMVIKLDDILGKINEYLEKIKKYLNRS